MARFRSSDQHRTNECGQVYGQAKTPAISRLEDVPSRSRRIVATDLFVVPTISFRLLYDLLIVGHGRRQIFLFWRRGASDRKMDRKSNRGSLRLGTSSPISDPRSGWGLWRGLPPMTSINGHSRSTNVATLFRRRVSCDVHPHDISVRTTGLCTRMRRSLARFG